MTIQFLRAVCNKGTLIGCLFLAAGFFSAVARAGSSPGEMQQNQTQTAPKSGSPSLQPSVTAGAAAPAQAAVPKADPEEEIAYKGFYDASAQDTDKKAQMGEDFVQKYPSSRYDEAVYAGLVQVYLSKQDWDKFYASADKALALNPDDVSVLTTVGWVIPHTYNPNDPNAEKNLAKAEAYEKHSIDVLGALAKPANMTDEQFATSKAEDLAEAHSGLGLVYFRRQQFDSSAKELQQSVQASAHPDPTDFYILGVDLQNLNSNTEAAAAFNSCAQTPNGLQDECKKRADALKSK